MNRGQSSNDTFPTAMQYRGRLQLHDSTRAYASVTPDKKAKGADDVIMVGRTYFRDATPIRLGQVISGWVA